MADAEFDTYDTPEMVEQAKTQLDELIASESYADAERVARSLARHFEGQSPADGIVFLEKALDVIEKSSGTKEVDRYVVCLVDLAFLKMSMKRINETDEVLVQAQELEDAMGSIPHITYLPMARVFLAKGDFDEAEKLLDMAVAEQEPLPLEQKIELDQVYSTLAMVRLKKNPDDASGVELLDSAIQLCKDTYGEASVEVGESLTNKGMYFVRFAGDPEAAIEHLQQAVDVYAEIESPQIMQTSQLLVSLLARLGRLTDAAEVMEKMRGVILSNLGPDHPMLGGIDRTIEAFKSGKMPQMGGGHGHSHGGKPCHGHGHSHGGAHSHSHGGAHSHSHGGAHSHSHGGEPAAAAHGHTHGGKPCHGHGGASSSGGGAANGAADGCVVM